MKDDKDGDGSGGGRLLTPAMRAWAREQAESAPPLTEKMRDDLRLILWGPRTAAPVTPDTRT